MRDYKGALYFLMTETCAYNENAIIPIAKNAIDDLQELVNRNEPKKPLREPKMGHRRCPVCGLLWIIPEMKYCPDCGQKLDWSE